MSTIPAVGYPSDNARTEAEMKTFFDAILSVLNEIPGGAASTELTISSGVVTPTGWVHTLDTEGDAAADDLDTIAITNHPDSRLLMVRTESSARVVTLKHNTGAANGKILTQHGLDIVLKDPLMFALLLRVGTVWYAIHVGTGASVDASSGYETVRFKNLDVLTTGTSWSVPTGVYNILIRAWGPGGGGGKGHAASGNCGGGGGGGAYIERLCSVVPGDSIGFNLTSAVGGAGATADGATGSTGTALAIALTSADSGNDFSMGALSGLGGTGGASGTPGVGGNGGTPSGGYDMGVAGGPGDHGDSVFGGNGGAAGLGGGAGGRGQSDATNAGDGKAYGGGGGGSDTGDGGDGANAMIAIYY